MFKKNQSTYPDGKVVTWCGGSGTRLVVIPGGPGLGSGYMMDALGALAQHFCVNFFDLPGCGESEFSTSPRLDVTFESLHEMMSSDSAQSKLIVVAHSWGACLLSNYLNREDSVRPSCTVLLNPAPLDSEKVKEITGKLLARVSPEDLEKISELHTQGTRSAGAAIMRLGLPAYCGRNVNLPDIQLDYDIFTSTTLSNELSEFDAWRSISKMGKVMAIFGETDYIKPDDFGQVLDSFDSFEVLQGGHFLMCDPRSDLVEKIRQFGVKSDVL